MRKNKKFVMALAIILAIATVAAGATFAWFTAQDEKVNPMSTGQLSNGDVKIGEVFDPDDPFGPGVEINKDVWAVNTGSVPTLVRITLDEAISKLENNGNPAGASAVWDGTVANKIPQQFSIAATETGGAYATWEVLDLSASGCPFTLAAGSQTIPDSVTVRYKGFTSGTAPNVKTEYQFVVYATIANHDPVTAYDGMLQCVDVTLDLNKETKELTFGTFNFMEFTKLPKTNIKWTGDASASTPYGPKTFLETALTHVPSYSDALIELVFSGNVTTDISTATEGKWWYNVNDGYFYYIGQVGAGQATSALLDAIYLNEAASSSYCLMDFDLIVKMEAIQNVKEALSSTSGGGWGLTGTQLTDLLAALNAVDAFVL